MIFVACLMLTVGTQAREQAFDKIDSNQDGLISITEFLSTAKSSATAKDRKYQDSEWKQIYTGFDLHAGDDFLIDKDQLFAQQNLDPDEYELYLNVYEHLTLEAPVPDLVIYLQAPTNVLLERIQKRAINAEQLIELGYLENLNDAYTEFFHYYNRTSLLIVNSAEIDLVSNDNDYNQLVEYIQTLPNGTHYFNPKASLIQKSQSDTT